MTARKCGTCRWLRPRSDGKPFWHGHAYACLWRIPDTIKFPASWSDRDIENKQRRIAGYMAPGDGKDCACWEEGESIQRGEARNNHV